MIMVYNMIHIFIKYIHITYEIIILYYVIYMLCYISLFQKIIRSTLRI